MYRALGSITSNEKKIVEQHFMDKEYFGMFQKVIWGIDTTIKNNLNLWYLLIAKVKKKSFDFLYVYIMNTVIYIYIWLTYIYKV